MTESNHPATSVCIPTFSRPHFLREAVQSVLAQTDQDLEVVVGDDGALGRSVVDDIDDPRVRYHRNETRLGIAGNWTRMLDAARGDYLGLLMDDDRWLPEFLTRMRAVLDACPDVDVVFSNHTFDDGSNVRPRRTLLAPGTHRDFAPEYLRLCPVAVSAALYRRQCWERVRPLPDTAAADTVLFARMADVGCSFHYVDVPLMTYRVHEAMFSASAEFRDDIVRGWENIDPNDPRARRVRDEQLGRALISRACLAIQEARLDEAMSDLVRARALRGVRAKGWGLTVVACNSAASGLASRVTALRRRARAAGSR